MKKGIALLMTGIILAGGLLGCSQNQNSSTEVTQSSSEQRGENITIVFSQKDEWLGNLEAAAKDAADEYGINLVSQDSLSDTSKQIQFVTTAAANGEKAIIVNLVDPNIAPDVVEAAGDMKVVFVNRPPSDMSILNENVVYVGSDEMASGRYQGEYLAKYFNELGKTDISYILLNGILGQVSTTNRTKSVLQALKDNNINAKEASAPLACDYDRAEAMTQITPLITANTKYDCIISNNDAMALGAVEALENAGIDPAKIPIVGIDATADGQAAVASGKMAMTVFQNAKGQGYGALKAALNLINQRPINEGTEYEIDSENPYVIWIPFEPVTKDNVAEYASR